MSSFNVSIINLLFSDFNFLESSSQDSQFLSSFLTEMT